jgi:glutamate formiminotransferase
VAQYSLEQCAMTAHMAGAELWRRHAVPSYFYDAAAMRPDRALLEDVRRGQFEGLRDAVRRDVARRPDVGGPDLHPTAGAAAIGARRFLVAYNVYLDKAEIAIARAIAREIRASSGGLAGVKALGLMVDGMAQISINVTDFRVTSMGTVFAAIRECARRAGAQPVRGELIGLLPEAAYERDAEWVRQLDGFHADEKILERRLACPLAWPEA